MRRDDDFLEFYYATYGKLFSYIRRMEGIANTVEDVLQEVYYIAYINGINLSNHPSPTGWLFTTANNVVKNMKRLLRHEEISLETLTETQELAVVSEEYEDVEWKLTLKHVIKDEVDEKIIRGCILGYNAAEIAEQLAISEENVRIRLYRLRRKMQRNKKRW